MKQIKIILVMVMTMLFASNVNAQFRDRWEADRARREIRNLTNEIRELRKEIEKANNSSVKSTSYSTATSYKYYTMGDVTQKSPKDGKVYLYDSWTEEFFEATDSFMTNCRDKRDHKRFVRKHKDIFSQKVWEISIPNNYFLNGKLYNEYPTEKVILERELSLLKYAVEDTHKEYGYIKHTRKETKQERKEYWNARFNKNNDLKIKIEDAKAYIAKYKKVEKK